MTERERLQLAYEGHIAHGLAHYSKTHADVQQRQAADAKYGEVWRALDAMRRASPHSWPDLNIEYWAQAIASHPSGQ